MCDQRRRRISRLDRNLALQDFVVTKLICHGWTPEQIAAWLKYQQKELTYVSHETIYRWIYAPFSAPITNLETGFAKAQ
ncbi:hypothetical protein CHQ79_01920 [Francisella noatunensis subsp. orientalis]|uniref:Transposase n=1 Tax=Francisella orientalis TaxID=299583 RepID=A0AAW9YNK3_9GAMM|nr:hypothetical protein [Francisella orientalis]NIB61685.1 hypothetical protein [Francisella orientalis]NIB65167.1 hypothetical protein [Francisella orientalis]NIY51766.1 hypothetical protein [Francisella orientalis]NIY53245.1 hypothetical protein [Francisella orientalis]